MSATTDTIDEGAAERRPRARPMSAQDRRAAIVDATVPLILTRGLATTTKEIAEAAGVAEGTIFGVFADKEAVLAAAVDRVLDPSGVVHNLADVDMAQPLRVRLEAAVGFVQAHLETFWDLIASVGAANFEPTAGPQKELRRTLIRDALVPFFEPDRDQLTRSPVDAAHALVVLTWAETNPYLAGDTPTSARDIVGLLLDGIHVHTPCGGPS